MPETHRRSDGQTNHEILDQPRHRKSFERINVIVTILYDSTDGQNVDQIWWNCTPDWAYVNPQGVTGGDDGPGVMWILNVYPLAGSRPLPGTRNGGNHPRLATTDVSVSINWPAAMPNAPQPSTGRFDGPYQSTWLIDGQPLYTALQESTNYTDDDKIGYSVSMKIGNTQIQIDPEIELGVDDDQA